MIIDPRRLILVKTFHPDVVDSESKRSFHQSAPLYDDNTFRMMYLSQSRIIRSHVVKNVTGVPLYSYPTPTII